MIRVQGAVVGWTASTDEEPAVVELFFPIELSHVLPLQSLLLIGR
jgi:hypothetical protein